MLKIISSNIRFDNPADTINAWDERKDLLAQVINSFNPMILATQEGRLNQIQDFEKRLKLLSLFDNHREWIKERMYPNIFINKELVEVLSSGDIWLSKTPTVPASKSFDSAFPRLCVWAHISIKSNSKDFLFVNTHLDHVLDHTREKQINVLISEINKINTNKLPIIICGDFNESPHGHVRKLLMKTWSNLYDPWLSLNKKELSTFHKFKGFLPLDSEGARIDWFLIDNKFKAIEIEADLTHQGRVYPSDHFPIKMTIEC